MVICVVQQHVEERKTNSFLLRAEEAPGEREIGLSWKIMGWKVERAVWIVGDGGWR